MNTKHLLSGGLLGLGLSLGMLSANCLASPMLTSPDAGKLNLAIFPATGMVQIEGGAGASLSGYEIDSASGALDTSKWVNLTGFSLFSKTANSISETNFGTGPLLDGTAVELGAIFKAGGTHDLEFLAFNNAGDEVEGTVTYAPVPEPASLSLLGLGAMGLMARRRKA